MSETVGLREANQDSSALVERVARTGRGVRIVPVEQGEARLTAELAALLERTVGQKLALTRDCQEFRVQAMTMGRREPPHGTPQSTDYP